MASLPSPVSQPSHFHAVRFYESTEALSRIVADFLGEGLASGCEALVIATTEHITAIQRALQARGFDAARLARSGDLTVLDANTTLERFMRHGTPDPVLFRDAMDEVFRKIRSDRAAKKIRAYGEIVDILWRAGQTVAAVKVEMLWNELAQTHDFALVCGYSMGSFYKSAALEEICGQHTHVISAGGELGRLG